MSRLLLISDAVAFGGAEIAMFTAAEALATKNVSVTVGLAAPGERHRAGVDRLRALGVPVLTADGPLTPGPHGILSPLLRRASARRAVRLIERAAPDAILVNLATIERGAALVDAAEQSRLAGRLAGYLHLGQAPSTLGARMGWLRDRLVARHLARFDVLLTVSDATARSVTRFTRRPAVPVYPGSRAVRRSEWLTRDEARRRLGLDAAATVGLLGRVAFDQKGHDVAVRVAQRLRRLGVHARWAVIGDGPDLRALRRMVGRYGLANQFSFFGWRGDAVDILPAFDVLALPSRYEGLPLTAVEGLAAHVPVVAFAVDGLSELLEPPFAVPPFDETAFAEAVALVLNDPGRWPAQDRAALAARLCDPDAVAQRILAALRLAPAA